MDLARWKAPNDAFLEMRRQKTFEGALEMRRQKTISEGSAFKLMRYQKDRAARAVDIASGGVLRDYLNCKTGCRLETIVRKL